MKPPETKIETNQQKFGPVAVKIQFSGKDERTPVEKLKYGYWLYQILNTSEKGTKAEKPVTEKKLIQEASTTANEVSFDPAKLKEGSFLFSIVAINEFGLADESPAELTFTVDLTTPPIPEVTASLRAGKISILSVLKDNVPDFRGFDLSIFSPNDSKKLQYSGNEYVFNATIGEKYEIQVKSYDDVGNYSQSVIVEVDASQDKAPILEEELPVLWGSKMNTLELLFSDDWDGNTNIVLEATLSSNPLKIKENKLLINYITVSEGTNTLLLQLMDTKKNILRVEKEVWIDLTPPDIPDEVSLETLSTGYQIVWKKSPQAISFGVYGSNDGNDWQLFGSTKDLKYYSSERYLHFAISAFDQAGNESHISYPVRSYDEMYSPVISSTVEAISGNTLLTTLFSPYQIKKQIKIPADTSLAFERGVEIVFSENGSFEVEGELISIPSRTDKYSIFTLNNESFQGALIKVENGNLWFEGIHFENEKKESLLFAMERNSNIMISDAVIRGFATVLQTGASDSFQITNSVVDTDSFITGDSMKNLKITDTEIKAVKAIQINNVQNLFLSETTIHSSVLLMRTSGLSNIKIENSNLFSEEEGIQTLKLTVIDLFSSNIEAKNTAISLTGASSLNMRKSTIKNSGVGIFASQSSYVSISESEIAQCQKGSSILNSDMSVSNSVFSNNLLAVQLQGKNSFEEVKVTYSGNQTNIQKNEP